MGVGLKHSHFWTQHPPPEVDGIPIIDVTALVGGGTLTALVGNRNVTARTAAKRATALAGDRTTTAKAGSRTTGTSEQ